MMHSPSSAASGSGRAASGSGPGPESVNGTTPVSNASTGKPRIKGGRRSSAEPHHVVAAEASFVFAGQLPVVVFVYVGQAMPADTKDAAVMVVRDAKTSLRNADYGDIFKEASLEAGMYIGAEREGPRGWTEKHMLSPTARKKPKKDANAAGELEPMGVSEKTRSTLTVQVKKFLHMQMTEGSKTHVNVGIPGATSIGKAYSLMKEFAYTPKDKKPNCLPWILDQMKVKPEQRFLIPLRVNIYLTESTKARTRVEEEPNHVLPENVTAIEYCMGGDWCTAMKGTKRILMNLATLQIKDLQQGDNDTMKAFMQGIIKRETKIIQEGEKATCVAQLEDAAKTTAQPLVEDAEQTANDRVEAEAKNKEVEVRPAPAKTTAQPLVEVDEKTAAESKGAAPATTSLLPELLSAEGGLPKSTEHDVRPVPATTSLLPGFLAAAGGLPDAPTAAEEDVPRGMVMPFTAQPERRVPPIVGSNVSMAFGQTSGQGGFGTAEIGWAFPRAFPRAFASHIASPNASVLGGAEVAVARPLGGPGNDADQKMPDVAHAVQETETETHGLDAIFRMQELAAKMASMAQGLNASMAKPADDQEKEHLRSQNVKLSEDYNKLLARHEELVAAEKQSEQDMTALLKVATCLLEYSITAKTEKMTYQDRLNAVAKAIGFTDQTFTATVLKLQSERALFGKFLDGSAWKLELSDDSQAALHRICQTLDEQLKNQAEVGWVSEEGDEAAEEHGDAGVGDAAGAARGAEAPAAGAARLRKRKADGAGDEHDAKRQS